MNFYDKQIGTPFMFRDCIIRVLANFVEKRYAHLTFCLAYRSACHVSDQCRTGHFVFYQKKRKHFPLNIAYCVWHRTFDEVSSDGPIRYALYLLITLMFCMNKIYR